ncbi:MAG TPA: M23 family metallopeptidase [Alphaproteobacteria bacterium]|nr:M23 family metallopeptidase [Alphaproteobacteria bacterium]
MRPKSPASRVPAGVFGRPRKAAGARADGIRPAIFYATFAALFGTNVLTLVGFLMAPDIAGLMNGQNDLVLAAYEDRIAQLRLEVDRLHSRQYAQAGDINLQLQELTQQQELLLEQHAYVKLLAEKAAELGIETADLAPMEAEDDSPPRIASDPVAQPGSAVQEIAAAAQSLQTMMDDSRLALAAISQEANSAANEIVGALESVGIRPALPGASAMGGPFIPAAAAEDTDSIVDEANAVYEALARLKAARLAIDDAPVHKPLAGPLRMSSTFGNRRDPFTGRHAFHAGLDFPSPTGTTVLSAGRGKVTFVGKKPGYGNAVEITHATGLVTRYGHLSAFLVKEGQQVQTGTPIAKVGSTGRSTGPHLHFEVRRDDRPVDPSRFLAVGKRLLPYLAG